MFHYQITAGENRSVIELTGDMDIDSSEIVKEQIIPESYPTKQVEINFAKVRFVDSTGIGLLIDLVNNLKKSDKEIAITNVSPGVQEVFSLLQLPDILGKEMFV